MENDALLFKALADPTRLRLMVILAVSGETCVCRLTEALGMSGSTVSRHLGVLRGQGLVRARRQGTWMHYSIASPAEGALKPLLGYFVNELSEDAGMAPVLGRLNGASCGTGRR